MISSDSLIFILGSIGLFCISVSLVYLIPPVTNISSNASLGLAAVFAAIGTAFWVWVGTTYLTLPIFEDIR